MLECTMLKVGHCTHFEKLTRRNAGWSRCPFPSMVALIRHPVEGYILFDTGYSTHFFDETETFPNRLYRYATPVHFDENDDLVNQLLKKGIEPDEISAIIISHFHADHIAGLKHFPKARIFSSKEGWNHITNIPGYKAVFSGLLPGLVPADFKKRVTFFEDLQVQEPGATSVFFEYGMDLFGDETLLAIPLPGHAKGQYGLLFQGSSGQPVFLVADAAWSINSITEFSPPMALTNLFMKHTKAYPETLYNLHQLHNSNSDIIIVPSHCREMQAGLINKKI